MAAARSGPRQRLGEDERRSQIIDGCVAALARHGYRHTSLAQVALAAGVSKGLVSHYFSDREALMEQTALATVNALRDDLAARIDTTAPVAEVIRSALHEVVALGRTHGAHLRAVNAIVHNLRRADGSPRLDLHLYEETYRQQQELFRRGQRSGELRDFDTRVMAVTYQGAIDTMLAYLASHSEQDADEYADALADLLINAISR
ncbi:TetR/AcrR family transcriptional regulator [Microlunatus soli]|uniref:DNA-binding transcriptional regulator, AcrR family n=1 Tax=Microlunatus soli TaxID=630515 RepID=A0A1H1TDG2_9ACTN|nr:TetR/AcrR family transcriptional regulator [Microlunatus soli]SDS58355.1 DNA-binding transcriptional regulator, AcrR family [Microlunatus soli]